MPKIKTHKATAKRIKITGSGKLMRVRGAKSHLLTHKSDRKKTAKKVSNSEKSRIKRLVPYLK